MLDAAGLRSCFSAIVAAENVSKSKPAPDAYLEALKRINEKLNEETIEPEECLVVEDSRQGIDSAHAAGMKCLAVANSYEPAELTRAEKVVLTLADARVSELEGLFK